MNDPQITTELTAECATPETEAGVKTVVEPDTALAKLSTVAAVTAELAVELTAERTARKALTKALMICIRYADSSADTEQAHAALALAAKLL